MDINRECNNNNKFNNSAAWDKVEKKISKALGAFDSGKESNDQRNYQRNYQHMFLSYGTPGFTQQSNNCCNSSNSTWTSSLYGGL
jgi:hypothetical protein